VTLVDTNVLLDMVTEDAVWADWSQRRLEAAAGRGPVLINDAVYAELSVGFLRKEEVDEALAIARVEMAAMLG
jgi:predicted nucleic acid-binding protein